MSFVSFKSLVASISLAVSAAIGISAAPAFAQSTFATGVDQYTEGTGIKASQRWRANTDNALGSYLDTYKGDTSEKNFFIGQNKDFLSLGLGGEAVFEFGTLFFPEITVWETTHGDKGRKQNKYDEQVEVFVGNDKDSDNWISLGRIYNIADGAYDNSDGATIKGDSGISNQLFKYVKLVDRSPNGNRRDGFDVNAIAVKSVPEPASILGLLTVGVVGGGSLGKRKKKQ